MAIKILYTASTFGHLAAFHQPYMQWFSEQGYEVHAAAGGEEKTLAGVSRLISLPLEKKMTAPANFRAAAMLARLMREEHYTLVSTHTALAAFFTRLALRRAGKGDTVMMNTSHGYLFDADTKGAKRLLLLGAERFCAPVTDYVLTMNRQDEMIARQYCLGKEIVQTPGMGVDFSRFSPADKDQRQKARAAFGFTVGQVVFVYPAEFSTRKNQRMLIEALPSLPKHVALLLPGRGEQLGACVFLAETLGVRERVVCPGFVPDIERCYQAADLAVSASRIEGLPFNLMEAMHCALPVVASRIKGHEDLVTDGENGLLFPYNNKEAFVQAASVLLDPQQRARMGQAAQRSVERYGLPSVLPQLTAIYGSALAQVLSS